MALKAEVNETRYGAPGSPPIENIGQGSFDEQAKRNYEQYSRTFGKFVASKDEGEKFTGREKERRDRAKRANKIYKQVCEDVGLKSCFFSNFGDWAEYVNGKMSDTEFETNTLSRAKRMKEEN